MVADSVGITAGWAGAGGTSQYISEPSYQLPYQSTGFRTTPDVSFNASADSTFDGYYGTSTACPCWAGLIAIANQGRVDGGGPTLDSTANPEQTLEALYSLPASDYNDVTSGYNGLDAGPGYDEDTGRGSPIANSLVPDLVNYGLKPVVTSVSPNTGLTTGGYTVTINGTGFVDITQVSFGTVPATSFTVVSNTQIVATVPAESAGTVDITVTKTAGGVSDTSAADTFTYGTVPSVTSQPNSQTVTTGSTVTFTAAASGSPSPTVQWQVSTNGITFSNIPGTTSTTLSFTALTGLNGYEYRAVFTNTLGSVTTNPTTLTVDFAPTIGTQPNNQTVAAGNSVSFTATATGNPSPTVQWQLSTDGGTTFSNIAGATATTLSFTASADLSGNEYQAVFTNSVGSVQSMRSLLPWIRPPLSRHNRSVRRQRLAIQPHLLRQRPVTRCRPFNGKSVSMAVTAFLTLRAPPPPH